MRSPPRVTTDCPAVTSGAPPSWSTITVPASTSVISSNSGVWKGSDQPAGATMRATETDDCRPAAGVLTAPTCSSMTLPPGTGIRVGEGMSSGTIPTLDPDTGPGKRVWICDNPAKCPGGVVVNGCPAASYSPTPSPVQYHRR